MQHTQDQGVSEAIGFILIFSMVVLGIGLVSLYGYPVLAQQQTQADVRNMEQTLIVLQNDIKSLCYKNVPYKETSLKVGGGSLGMFNTSLTSQYFSIGYWNQATLTFDYIIREFHPGMLKYEADASDAVIALENGGVIQRQELQTGSSMLAEPRWFYDDETKTLVVYFIALNASELHSRNGIGVIKLQHDIAKDNFTEIHFPSAYDVYVNYSADPDISFETAWENYLINSVGMEKLNSPSNNPDPLDLSVIFNFRKINVEKLVIKQYEIKVLSL
ncbi:MAG: hypothetical protein EHJ95_05210 [Methanobacteriota archaeon]|nr:MAG: hypothetical protein EHJ95_05210 [Euryarchaeota archaeon]